VTAEHISDPSASREEPSEAPRLPALGGYRVLLNRPARRGGRVLVLGAANPYDREFADETRVLLDAVRAGFVVLSCRRLAVVSREASGHAYLLHVRDTGRGLYGIRISAATRSVSGTR
jgi:hypothetical protein